MRELVVFIAVKKRTESSTAVLLISMCIRDGASITDHCNKRGDRSSQLVIGTHARDFDYCNRTALRTERGWQDETWRAVVVATRRYVGSAGLYGLSLPFDNHGVSILLNCQMKTGMSAKKPIVWKIMKSPLNTSP